MTFGSLFAGIGGFDLGFEIAGLKCLWQVEKDQYCLEVLKKRWPDVKKFDDILTLKNPPYVDVVCGGFPCQDISNAWKRKGIKGERSGLWSEMLRIICEVRPKFAVMENVAALVNRGLSTVLSELAESGYDAEWQVLSAKAFGAPHLRERVFIVAYSKGQQNKRIFKREIQPNIRTKGANVSNANQFNDDSCGYDPSGISQQQKAKIFGSEEASWWEVEPDMGRMANGVSRRVDRLKCLGNAVVPQITEYIGRLLITQLTN